MPLAGSECHRRPWRPMAPLSADRPATTEPAPGQRPARIGDRWPGNNRYGRAGNSRRKRSISSDHLLEAEADVHGARRVGDGAGGNEIRTGFRVGADISEGDAAGKLDLGAAGDLVDSTRAAFFGREIVEQQPDLARGIQRLTQFFAGMDFDF